MSDPGVGPSTFTVTVLTRHAGDCPKKDNPQWKRCRCRKSLYIYEDGKRSYKSTKTRSWEEAENMAQEERDARDPVKLRLKEIEEQEAKKAIIGTMTVDAALDAWAASQKEQTLGTAKAYRTTVRKVKLWAASKGIVELKDITPFLLDEWRSKWSLTAERIEDRMGATSQSQYLTRIRSFFMWSTQLELISRDPSVSLRKVKPGDYQTIPLTPEQFNKVIQATYKYNPAMRRSMDRFGDELRALFILQRWTGLRIIDAAMLPRAGLVGNRIKLVTQKTKKHINRVVPDEVVEALAALKPRPDIHPDYFFWSGKCNHLTLTKKWTGRILKLNDRFLDLKDETGAPLKFMSHMLRNTFAVELLLQDVPIEEVSQLLTHASIRTTEKYYAPWIKARELKMEDRYVEAMKRMGATLG